MANQNFVNVNPKNIAKLFNGDKYLAIVTNSYHEYGYVSEYANIYLFTKEDFLNDKDLCALLFGRTNSKGIFKSCKIVTNNLFRFYMKNYYDTFCIVDLVEYATTYGFSNLGIAIEHFLVNKYNGKHASIKEDKGAQKRDILIDSHFWQIKCSLATAKTKLSYSTTNDKI